MNVLLGFAVMSLAGGCSKPAGVGTFTGAAKVMVDGSGAAHDVAAKVAIGTEQQADGTHYTITVDGEPFAKACTFKTMGTTDGPPGVLVIPSKTTCSVNVGGKVREAEFIGPCGFDSPNALTVNVSGEADAKMISYRFQGTR